ASYSCCQAPNLPWAPIPPPPHAAARPVICHGPPYRLVTLLLGPQCDMGPCTASHCSHSAMCHFQVSSHSCWFPFCHRLLADYSPPIGAARPQICHGPPYRLVTLLLGPQCDMGPCTPPIAPTLPCATFRSPHTPAGFHFVIGCCMASHCCCL
ncbi:unnamed protein product, partial [Staurois parvus]